MKNSFKLGLAVVLTLICTAALAATVNGYDTNGKTVTAEVSQPGGTTDSGALRVTNKCVVLYDSGDVANGAVITSPVIDVSKVQAITTFTRNASGTVSRTLAAEWMDDAGNNVSTASVAAGTNVYQFNEMGRGATGTFGFGLSTKMRFSLSAGGASIGRLIVWGR